MNKQELPISEECRIYRDALMSGSDLRGDYYDYVTGKKFYIDFTDGRHIVKEIPST